jgi:Tfp pilus assembly protein PilO
MEKLLELYSKITMQHKIIITLIALAAALGMGYQSAIVPAEAQLEAARANAAALETEINSLQELNKSMVTIQDELRRATDEMTALKAILPEEPDIESLLSDLSAAAKATGVTIVSFEPKSDATGLAQTPEVNPLAAQTPEPSNPDVSPAPGDANQPSIEPIAYKTEIEVQVSGSFSQIVSFYDRTLQFERIIHLSSFDLSIRESGDKSNIAGRTLTARTSFFAYSQQSKFIPPSLPKAETKPPGQSPSPPPAMGPVSHVDRKAPRPLAENSPFTRERHTDAHDD